LEIRQKTDISVDLPTAQLLSRLRRELFKPSKDSASLQVCNEKKIGFGFRFFL